MAISNRFADIAQKSAVILLAGTTVYYMVNVGFLVNRRIGLKKEGKLHEELARLNAMNEDRNGPHAETSTTPTPFPDTDRPGTIKDL
ncbi:hypothetical protein K501DRAFT_17675 [Backusella circina FSU 941]|nr:hypothetical protein K501DRAFT_17675 [Backusella circina FSU 941]